MGSEQQETKKNSDILLSTNQEKGNDPLCHHSIYLTHSCVNRKKICSFLRYPSILNTSSLLAQLFSYMYRIKKVCSHAHSLCPVPEEPAEVHGPQPQMVRRSLYLFIYFFNLE